MLKAFNKNLTGIKKLNVKTLKNFRSSNQLKEKIEIFIDDKPYQVDSSQTIWQACWDAGVIIPRFCFHERLSIAGNCRMCLVEVEKSLKPIAACASQVMRGMSIKTKSEATRIHRGGVVEFILANHPLDCPICDQGGECDLQDISQVYGYGEGRFMEYKRAVEDKNYGPLVGTSMNRCIHCTRCVRFANEIAGSSTLGKVGRGKGAEIGTYIEKMFNSELSGNIVDICPVGALTNQPYAFTSRPWELKEFYTTDVLESLGASVQVDTRGAEIMRVLPRIHEDVNTEWISDKTRHGFDGLKRQRITSPMRRDQEGNHVEINWLEAIQTVSKKFQETPSDKIGAIIGELQDCESIVALKDLFNNINCDNFEVRTQGNTALDADLRSNYLFNSQINGVEESDLVLLIGTDLKQESPILNSRILQQVNNSNLKVFTIGTPQDLTYNQVHLGNTTKVLEEIASGNHPFAKRLQKAQLPMIILGENQLQREDGAQIHNLVKQIAQKTPVLNEELGWNGLNILHKSISRVGALDLGITSSNNIKDAKLVVLLGADNDIKPSDIPEDAFVVYIGSQGDEGAYYADIILPGASYIEKEGTYVNIEGRVQQGRQVVSPPGQARADWQILRALSEELGCTLPYDTVEEIRYRMAELAPHLIKYDYIEPSLYGKLSIQTPKQLQQKQSLNSTPLSNYIDNYYMTDAITRSSVTMAKCSTAFNADKHDNFLRV